MTRKPTAIRLSKTKESASSKKQAPPSNGPNKSQHRKPRALAVPENLAYEDYFDQPPFADDAVETQPPSHLPNVGKGIRWFAIFIAAVTSLISIALAFKIQSIVDELFLVHPVLGWFAIGLTALGAIALLALILREIVSLLRLKKLAGIRERAEQVFLGNKPPQQTIRALHSLYGSRADMRWHIDRLKSHEGDIIDGPDYLMIAERNLMTPLDAEARQIIASSAKRISVVTTLNPSPVLDILFVGFQILQMLRKLMVLYGGKPALFGALKLVRMVATHLAVTGGLAMSDTLLQQFIGKGLAGRLSAKLGEGTVNGIMATRIGLAAMDLCRPLPYCALERPNLKSFLAELFKPRQT